MALRGLDNILARMNKENDFAKANKSDKNEN